MDTEQIKAALVEVFDQAIVFHAYAAQMRDYDLFIYATADPRTGIQPEHLRYRFTHCVSATVTSALTPAIWKSSLDDRLTDYEAAMESELDGYVWGVNWQCLYPGMTLVEESASAERWARDLGIPFHEVTVETDCHNLKLIFSDLVVTTAEPGLTPFVVPSSGPDWKIPLP